MSSVHLPIKFQLICYLKISLNPHGVVCVILTVWVVASNWNDARSDEEPASGPGVIPDDIKGSIHVCTTLPCVPEVSPDLFPQQFLFSHG